ncbi:MAG: methyltransferase domain-containing protein [Armatimonadetes bacterium]|nr:methyltransferase domain-containing protein [Armatimonadota bacterium]
MAGATSIFDDGRAERYDRIISRIVIGYEAMHRLARAAVLQETDVRRILVCGVGTAEEAIALAHDLPEAQLVGFDTSSDMLAIAQEKVHASGLSGRIDLVHGDVHAAPSGPFDVVTDLLVAHFVPSGIARQGHFTGIADRLKPSGLLVEAALVAGPYESLWRSVLALGFDAEKVEDIVQGFHEDVDAVSVPAFEGGLADCGFNNLMQIWQSLYVRMWTARKSAPKY